MKVRYEDGTEQWVDTIEFLDYYRLPPAEGPFDHLDRLSDLYRRMHGPKLPPPTTWERLNKDEDAND